MLVGASGAYASELTISNVSPDRYFSPNGDNQDDTAYVNYTLSTAATVTIVIRDKGGSLVRTISSGTPQGQGGNQFSWNGREENGTPAANGVYKYTITAVAGAKEEASASGQIGLNRALPGTVTKPTPEATITGTSKFVFTPTAGETVDSVSFYGRCPSYPYTCLLGTAIATEPDGTFAVESEVGGLSSGSNEIITYVTSTDPFGQEHFYAAPVVPVTVAYPEQISSLSPNRYFYPNGSGQEETAYVSYGLSTAAKVTVVLRNSSNQVVKTLLNEAEQGPGGGSFSWDGTDASAKPVAAGVYTYTITAAGTFGSPATATGKVGLDRNLPGKVTKPESGATLTGSETFVFKPTPGENVTGATFYGRCPSYPYTCFLGSTLGPEPDGSFDVTAEVGGLASGANEVVTYASFVDPFGQEHNYSAPVVPVTIAYPEQISNVTPDRYFYPNGSGQEEIASVSYGLSTAAKVTVVLRNNSNEVVRTLIKEVEQGPGGGSFEWDGTDASSKPAPPGVYTYTITATGKFGLPASATGKIGLDRNLPGTVTKPTLGATLTGTSTFVFTPTSGENVTRAYFYGRCPNYPYSCFLGEAASPEPDGTFAVSDEVSNLKFGSNEITTGVTFTDPFGQQHGYSPPAIPVTVAYPEQISSLSADRYLYPSVGEESTSVSYTLAAPAKVTVVLRNAANEVVKELLSEAEQTEGGNGFSWDGTNASSKPAPDGVYTYTITATGSDGPPATATGKIGLDHNVPGKVVKPETNATLTGFTTFAFAPTPGENVTHVYYYGHCPIYYSCFLGESSSPEPDGTFDLVADVSSLTSGANEIFEYASFTDPFGQGHSYSAPVVPVTVHAPGQAPIVSASAQPNNGKAPLKTTFTIEAPQPEGHSLNYTINFGDGSTEQTGAVPGSGTLTLEHTYTQAGVERATISVFDEDGDVAEAGVTVTVSAANSGIPVNELAPSISGNSVEGETLTESHGLWSGTPTSYQLQWLRCGIHGTGCKAITGSTTSTYLLTAADLGHTIEVREIARNETGPSAAAFSNHTEIVTIPKPAGKKPPTIAGTPSEGANLTEEHGAWSGEPTEYRYQWLQCSESGTGCAPISGQTTQTYVTTAHDLGHTIAVEETAINAGGSSEPALSTPTAPITAAAPVNTAPPTIIGAAENGQTLVEQHGTWRNEPTGYAYRWLRCNTAGKECSAIAGAVNQTYIATTNDLHHTVEVEEVARNTSGNSAPATSAPSPTITSGPLHASAGENISTVAGLLVKLDGSGSSPAGDIETYKWEFGDGANAEGATVSHVYTTPGEYTATLTVTRNGESASATTKVSVAPQPAHEATVLVTDAAHNPLDEADVVFIGPGGTRIQAVTGGDGKATLPGLPDGTDAVYAYKPGFQPNTGHVTASGGAGETTIVLATGEIATSTIKSHELTLKEIGLS